VTATKAGDATYNAASSPTATETFNKANQSLVTLSATSVTLPATINLTTLVGGGSGTGAFSYTLLSAARPPAR